jgi:hypothetical protein
MNMNYYDTFIQVASDCPVTEAVVPTSKREKKSIPQIEYELLAASPYQFTQEELLFAVHVQREGISKNELKTRRAAMWKEFFGKPHACLRASMLPKKYGWGLHFDSEGRIALVPMDSAEYRAFVDGKGVATLVTAMRNKRA